MADESQVAEALATIIAGIVYPSGSDQPSIVGNTCRIYRGWPGAAALDADLLDDVLNVSVFSRPGMVRNTTRWLQIEKPQPATPPTIAATVAGAVVTFAGTITAGNLVGIQIGTTGFGYQVQALDTLASIATYFATLLGGTSAGPAVTVPTNKPVQANTLAQGTATRETRRTEQGFMVTVWAPDPATRDAVSAAIDNPLSDMPFIPVGIEVARLRFQTTMSSDKAENENLYRRDLIYHIEYGTQIVTTPPRALFVGGDITRLVLQQPDINTATAFGQTYPPIVLDGNGQPVLDGDDNQIFQGFDL